MKSVNKMKDKKLKITKKPKMKTTKEKVLKVAQEIKFARLLAGNDKKTRDRVLKSFKKWLLSCFERGHKFKEDDFLRVWKGLFYAVWMSDKPLVQEELCETIAGILDLFPPKQLKYALLMFKAGLKVLATEWYGIDQHRMDKYLMLVRRYLRGSLRCLLRSKWKTEACKAYANTIAGSDGILAVKTPLYARNAGSMLLHFMECFLEELSKVSDGNIPPTSVLELLRPVCEYMVHGENATLSQAARRVLTQLLRQSDQGIEYTEKTRAWKQMGCPIGGPDSLELMTDDEDEDVTNGHQEQDDDGDDDENGERPLDPRAGRVDVTLRGVPVPAAALARALRALLATAGSKAHQRTKICLQRFEQLASGQYPLRAAGARVRPGEDARARPGAAARALRALEERLVAASDELAMRGLSRKHRKRLLAQSRAGQSIVTDKPPADITSTNGDWEVKATTPKQEKETKKQTDKISNKENRHTDKHSNKRKNNETLSDKNIIKKKKTIKDDKNKLDKATNTQIIENGIKNTKIRSDKVKNDKEKSSKVNQKEIKVSQTTDKSLKFTQTNQKEIKVTKIDTTPKKPIEKSKKLFENKTKSPIKSDKKIIRGKVEKRRENVKMAKNMMYSQKKVKFVLKNNSMQGPVDYYKSVRQSPNIPYDGKKKPSKTNLKVSAPSPINPFFKKKLRLK